MKRFVVVGLGNFGSSVAEALYADGHDVTTVDTNEVAVDRIARRVTRAAVGDGTQVDTLLQIGAKDADAGIVSTGDDISASILTTLALKDIDIPEIYVKVISLDHARVLDKVGVTETIFPERESGQRLATRIESRSILNYVRLGPDFSIQEMAVPEDWIGQSLRELMLPRRFRISVVAVHDMLHDQIIPVPDPDSPLKDSDTLLISGHDKDLARAARVK